MAWTDTSVMVLDFETTSIDACRTRPVQIGFAIFDPSDDSFTNELNVIVDTGVKSHWRALETHGITDDRILKEGVPVKETFESLIETITKYSDYPIMMYNAPFDFTILNQECKRHKLQLPKLNVLDPLVWARKYYSGRRNLGAIAKKFEIPHANAHDALADVRTTARVALAITKRNLFYNKGVLHTASITDLQKLQKEWSGGSWPTRLCTKPSPSKNKKITGKSNTEHQGESQESTHSPEITVSLLERLLKLLESGAITRSEFDEQKRRILNDSSTPDQLSEKNDIDLRGWDLHRAATENRSDIARAVIALGDDVNAENKNGLTPLHCAAQNNSLEVARLLIEKKADIDAREERGCTPLHCTAEENFLDMARLLIEKKADIEAREERGCTPLHYAAKNNSLEVARLLIEKDADIEAREERGCTPLHCTAEENFLDMARLLIEKDADIDARTKISWTPLHYAVFRNSIDMVRLLIEKGADIDLRNADGDAPLHLADQKKYLDIAQLLIKLRANTYDMELS